MTAEEEGGPLEHHLEVRRTARYWTLGRPGAREVWFVLHGYKQLARRFSRRFASIAGPERLVVAPEGLSRFYARPEPGRHGPASVVGASWMTREDRLAEIGDYVGYLDRLADTVLQAPAWVTVLGFSQGAATAARWVTLGRVRAARLVLWGGYVPPDLDMERARPVLAGTELLLVRGAEDPGLDEALADQEAGRLEAAGIDYRTVAYGGGHEIDPETLAWLAEG